VLIIALAQALALVPGTSRSGITMTAGLLCGMSRVSAARFSFLLSIPLIVAAGTYKFVQLWQMQVAVQWLDIGLGVVMSFVAAFVCIYLFLRWIERLGFMMFVVYRILLSAVLFSFIYFGA
jgi:undecaprenyl-diphosphatase